MPKTNQDPGSIPSLSGTHIDTLVAEAFRAFDEAFSVAELKQARIDHIGDRSPLALANRQIASLPQQEKRDAGKRIGTARGRVQQAFDARHAEVSAAELENRLAAETVDVTLPVQATPVGAQHPVTALIDLMSDIFVAMGWEIAEGPELEAEWLNFDALNIPPDHPARTMHDTLFIDPPDHNLVLRTHTSPVQARALLDREPPVYVVAPGRVYRDDEYDATHLPMFHQIEGMAVDEGISFAHLRGTLEHFARELFGEDVVFRWRPSYFPFTEPSAEVDLQCFVCRGASVDDPAHPCRVCKSEGWIEWGGCGVMNPRVLTACGVDSSVYSGFAFGMGIDRTLMFRNGLQDLRDIVQGDVRFSRSLVGGAR